LAFPLAWFLLSGLFFLVCFSWFVLPGLFFLLGLFFLVCSSCWVCSSFPESWRAALGGTHYPLGWLPGAGR